MQKQEPRTKNQDSASKSHFDRLSVTDNVILSLSKYDEWKKKSGYINRSSQLTARSFHKTARLRRLEDLEDQKTMNIPLQTYYSRIYRSYDLVNRLFTFGLDKKWRRYTAHKCLESAPRQVVDLCCGTGDMAIALSRQSTGQVSITGYDLNAEMLELAREKAATLHNPPVFLRGDAAAMPFESVSVDCITIGFGFRNLTWENPQRDEFIHEMARVLKPGGRLLILESARPENRVIAWLYDLYLKLILIPLGGIISGNREAYRYLAGSSSGFYPFHELQGMLRNHQLNLQKDRTFLFGSVNLLIATKTP